MHLYGFLSRSLGVYVCVYCTVLYHSDLPLLLAATDVVITVTIVVVLVLLLHFVYVCLSVAVIAAFGYLLNFDHCGTSLSFTRIHLR